MLQHVLEAMIRDGDVDLKQRQLLSPAPKSLGPAPKQEPFQTPNSHLPSEMSGYLKCITLGLPKHLCIHYLSVLPLATWCSQFLVSMRITVQGYFQECLLFGEGRREELSSLRLQCCPSLGKQYTPSTTKDKRTRPSLSPVPWQPAQPVGHLHPGFGT